MAVVAESTQTMKNTRLALKDAKLPKFSPKLSLLDFQNSVFPPSLGGKDIENRDDWIYKLNDAQLDEIDAALKCFKGACVSLTF
jgi:hypothetical protein